ncbi:hypothetical protein [Bosea sp. F3-2]|nr:hypothetical protein [Bosea sp. F3-2]
MSIVASYNTGEAPAPVAGLDDVAVMREPINIAVVTLASARI